MKEFFQKAVDLFAAIPDFAMGLLLLLFAILAGAIGALITKAILARTRLGRRIREIEKENGRKVGSASHAVSGAAKLVFLLLFLLFLPAALTRLGLEGVMGSVNLLTESLLSYVPNVIGCVLLLVVGALLADVAFLLLVSLFATLSLDRKLNGWLGENKNKSLPFSKIFAYTVKTLIFVLFVVEGVNVLGFSVLTSVGRAVIAYLPALLVAVLFSVLALVGSRLVDTLLKNSTPFLRTAAKGAIIVTSLFIVLSHLGIAPFIVNTAFIILFSSCGVAFALSGGLGGRQFVQDNLSGMKLFKKKEENKEQNQEKNQNDNSGGQS